MPSSADLLLDTSAALALVLSVNEKHTAVTARVGSLTLGLCGHAEFEFLSSLTRLPEPHRVSATLTATLMAETFPATYRLSARGASHAIQRMVSRGISGGAVFDGLVALAAEEAGITLLSCDRRALPTYATLGVAVEIV